MTKKIQLRINPLRHSPDATISGAALSHIMQKIVIPTQEKTTSRTKPKTMKPLLGQHPNMMNWRTGMIAHMNRP